MAIKVTQPELNLREVLKDIDTPRGAIGTQLLAADTAAQAHAIIQAGRKNLIINGDHRISQRGDFTSATAATNNTYYTDRWNTDFTGVSADITHTQSQVLPNGEYSGSLKLTATSTATGYLQLRQKIETEDWMQGQTVTFSAWVRSNNPLTRLRLESGSADSGNNLDGYERHAGNGEWQFMKMTAKLKESALSALHLGVICWDSATMTIDSGTYVEIALAQLEVGIAATPFERRSIAEEFSICQRYYFLIGTKTGASNDHAVCNVTYYTATDPRGVVFFPVEMRRVPTFDAANGTNYFRILTENGTDWLNTVDAFVLNTKTSAGIYSNAGEGNGNIGNSGLLFIEDNAGWIEFDAEI